MLLFSDPVTPREITRTLYPRTLSLVCRDKYRSNDCTGTGTRFAHITTVTY